MSSDYDPLDEKHFKIFDAWKNRPKDYWDIAGEVILITAGLGFALIPVGFSALLLAATYRMLSQ